MREEVPWRLACQGFDLLQPAPVANYTSDKIRMGVNDNKGNCFLYFPNNQV